jgi:hypothetical protein
MNLRYDPSANAAMAGAFTKANAARLTRALGRAPTDGELYIAHFLGQSGAVKLIASVENAPQTDAARLFPHAARANRSIFFDKAGGARSSADVYRVLVAKHDGTRMPPMPAVAAAPVQPVAPAVPATTATLAPVASPSIAAAAPAAPATAPMFSSLFSGERREGVSPFVRDLWGARSAGLVQPASASAGLLEPALMQPAASAPSVTVSPAAAVASSESARRAAPDPFRFLRPEAPANQGAWPI